MKHLPLRAAGLIVFAQLLASPGQSAPASSTAQDAFMDVYKVLMHPRCMNCHPVGNAPLQGDDSHPHSFRVQRGEDGGGVTSVRCTNCHQAGNRPDFHGPPGAPDPKAPETPRWRLPAPKNTLQFQQRTPAQLCRQLLSRSKNGGLTQAQLLLHVESDPLVMWGWEPGEGRTLPPLTHAEFVSRFRTWLDAGAGCPK